MKVLDRFLTAAVVIAVVLTSSCGRPASQGDTRDPDAFTMRAVLAQSDPPCPQGPDVFPEMKEGTAVACLRLGPPKVTARDVASARFTALEPADVLIRLTRAGAV